MSRSRRGPACDGPIPESGGRAACAATIASMLATSSDVGAGGGDTSVGRRIVQLGKQGRRTGFGYSEATMKENGMLRVVHVAPASPLSPAGRCGEVPVLEPLGREPPKATQVERRLGKPLCSERGKVEAQRLPDYLELSQGVAHADQPRVCSRRIGCAAHRLNLPHDRLGLLQLLQRQRRQVVIEERPRDQLKDVANTRLATAALFR
eukprot:scaffold6711_cov118-Isochrysis_galbana.AAC.37